MLPQKNGLNTLEKAVDHGFGSLEYNLIDIDSKDESISNKDSTQIEPTLNKDPTQSMDIKETGIKIDNKKEDNSFKLILSSVICITAIAKIIYIIFYMIKKRKKGNLEANEDLGQSSPEEKA